MVDTSLVTNLLAVDKVSGVLDKIGDKFGTFGKIAVASVAGIGGTAVAAGKLLYEVGATFDDLSDTIRTGTGATGAALDGLVDVAKNIGRNVPVEFDKIGPVVADLNTRLGLTGDTLDTVASQFLQAGVILGEDVDIQSATAALSVFGIQGDQVSGALDELFRVSQATGVGMNELSTSMNKSGGVVQQLGFSFSETASLIGVLDKAGIDSNAVLASMGKSLVTLAQNGEDAPAAFRRVTGEMKDMLAAGNDTAALDLASKVFGTRGAAQFVAALQTGKVNIDDMAAAAGMSSDTILGVAADTADMAESWQLFKNRALLAIEPIATRVFNAFGQGMAWFNSVGSPAMEKYAAIAQQKLAPIMTAAADIISNRVVPAVKSFGSFLTGTAIPAAKSFGEWLDKYKGWLIPVAVAVTAVVVAWKLYTTTLAIVGAATKAYTAMQAALNVVMSMNPIGLIVLALVGLVAGLVYAYTASETFREIVNGAFGAVLGVVTGVWNWVSDNWPLLLAILTGPIGLAVLAITSNWETIKGGFTAVKDWIGQRIDDIVGFVTGMPGRITSAASGMWDGITDAFKSAVNWIIRLWNGIKFPSLTIGGQDPLGSFGPSLPRVTIGGWSMPQMNYLAEGGFAPARAGGYLANISEGGDDEIVSPVPMLERIVRENSDGGGEVTVRLVIDGTGILSGLRKEVRVRAGGNVQLALGT